MTQIAGIAGGPLGYAQTHEKTPASQIVTLQHILNQCECDLALCRDRVGQRLARLANLAQIEGHERSLGDKTHSETPVVVVQVAIGDFLKRKVIGQDRCDGTVDGRTRHFDKQEVRRRFAR